MSMRFFHHQVTDLLSGMLAPHRPSSLVGAVNPRNAPAMVQKDRKRRTWQTAAWDLPRKRVGNATRATGGRISAQPHPHTHTPTHRERETREYPQRGPLDHFKDLLGGVGKCLLRHSFPAGHTLDVEERDVGMPRKPSTFLSQGTCVSSLVSR